MRRTRVRGFVAVTVAVALSAALSAPAGATSPAVTVRSISPARGSFTGGTTVHVHGTGFSRTSHVLFGSATATKVRMISSTELTAVAPRHRAGAVSVRVTSGHATSALRRADVFTYHSAPTVTNVSPDTGRLDDGAEVMIDGTGLNDVDEVHFGDRTVPVVSHGSAQRIGIQPPPGTAGTVDVRVSGQFGTSPITTADRYTYVPPPVVTSVSPSSGPTTGGTLVTVHGRNFIGVVGVHFAYPPQVVAHRVSDTELTFTAPDHVPGVLDLLVDDAYGESERTPVDQYDYVGEGAPSPVSSLTAVTTTDSVALSWTNPKDSDFVGVKIRRTTDYNAPPSSPASGDLVAKTSGTSFTDRNLSRADNPYNYAVYAYNAAGRFAPPAIVTVDLPAPAPVTDVVATGETDSIDLNWTNPSGYDFAGVTITRVDLTTRQDTSGGGTLDVARPPDQDSYVDNTVTAGDVYQYFVTAADGAGNTSDTVTSNYQTTRCVYRSVVHVSGEIPDGTRWGPDCAGTYVVDAPGAYSLSYGHLSVDPGTVVKAVPGAYLNLGTVEAVGTAEAPVTFTSIQDDSVGVPMSSGSPEPGDWAGLTVDAGRVEGAVVSFADTAISSHPFDSPDLTFDGNWLHDNVYAFQSSALDHEMACPGDVPAEAYGNAYGPTRSSVPFVSSSDYAAIRSAVAAGEADSPEGWTDHIAVGDTDKVQWTATSCGGETSDTLVTDWDFTA